MLDKNIKDTQITLSDEGILSYQENATNPLPGEAFAKIVKGDSALCPALELFGKIPDVLAGQTCDEIQIFAENWLKAHISSVLEPLVALPEGKDLPEPVSGICARLHEAMGILPRGELQDLIGALDQDMRQALRAKRVRLGPVLVFMPVLNKPAAVRLRGMLWALYHDKTLPAGVPNDGIVSLKVDVETADPDFYRAIGYPLYGPRAVRIDMLDRVIVAVYDSAKEGKFQARHEMAEWLGCSIDDLYAVLEAMGHKKIAQEQDLPVEGKSAQEKPVKMPVEHVDSAEVKVKTEEFFEISAKKIEPPKPELATFWLKKGKASESGSRSASYNKPFRKFDKKSGVKTDKKKGKRNKNTNRTPKVMSAGPKLEDSPFAILEQLKVKKDGS